MFSTRAIEIPTNSECVKCRMPLASGTKSGKISDMGTACCESESIQGLQFPILIHCVIRENILNNHVKTVVSYLNAYRNASPEDQEKYACCFSCYLLTACWRKMHFQIISWSAVGILQGLYSILTNDFLEQAINYFPWDSLSNKRG